jgi:anti-sigma B factor antagonist
MDAPGEFGREVLVGLPDEIDLMNARSVFLDLCGALRPGVAVVIADLTGTEFCDSEGFRHLLVATDQAAASGRRLRLVIRPGGAVRRALDVLGLTVQLAVYPDVAAAVSDGGGCEIRTREGLPPTRFPSVRPRPLGESSAGQLISGARDQHQTSPFP